MQLSQQRALILSIAVPLLIIVAASGAMLYYMTSIKSFIYGSIDQMLPKKEVIDLPDPDDTQVTIQQTLVTPPVVHTPALTVVDHAAPVVASQKPSRPSSSKLRILCNQAVYKGTAQCSK